MQPRPATNDAASPFHRGEQAVQSRLGVRERIEPWAKQVVRPFMPDQHREFYARLPFVVAAARDPAGRPWATLLVGPPGFVQSPDDRGLTFATGILPGDALQDSLSAGAELGLLGIELSTRRRNRVNGTITETGANVIKFEVSQSFGNCPQYITEREWRSVDVAPGSSSATRHRRLDSRMRAWIASADTFFIASGYGGSEDDRATTGMDASHRGGAPGFVAVQSDRRLVFPDYAGNNHFNTLGNLVMDPRVALLFVDFDNGSLLQISGKASIDWDSDEVAKFAGAQRLVLIDVEQVVQLDRVLPLRWSEPKGSVRSLRVLEKNKESEDVTSFVFDARDGGRLASFEAGQHLPIELPVDGHERPVKRTYSLSNGPGETRYRISVKREPRGIASRYLHDEVSVGDIVNSGKPDGDFVLEAGHRPVALVSAGIGVTPMVSMLHALADQAGNRSVHFIHGARDGAHHPLSDEIRSVVARRDNLNLEVVYSQPRETDRKGWDYHRRGRVTGDLIEELIPGLDADFYLCGPAGFLADVVAALVGRGVRPERIRSETFGPAA